MGDQLVLDIRKTLSLVAFANGIVIEQLDPVIDVLVNRMCARGWEDTEIKATLSAED